MAPDGGSLVVVRRGLVSACDDLLRVPLDGSPIVPLVDASAPGAPPRPRSPRISRDGRFVAFWDWATTEVYLRDLDIPGGTGLLQVTDAGGYSPVWGANSRSLYYRLGECIMGTQGAALAAEASCGRAGAADPRREWCPGPGNQRRQH